jgi:predicted house-cleaning NTP pyrophosphatase (Maf/HAM1 superfamily)
MKVQHDRVFIARTETRRLREHKFKFILASASPRRSELLRLADFRFDIIPSTVPEVIRYEEPSEIVMDISLQKALDVASNIEEDAVVLGCDTMVFLEEHKMGKPKDEQDAFAYVKKPSAKNSPSLQWCNPAFYSKYCRR